MKREQNQICRKEDIQYLKEAKGMPRITMQHIWRAVWESSRNLGSPGKERKTNRLFDQFDLMNVILPRNFAEFINCEIVKSKSLSKANKSFKNQLLNPGKCKIYMKKENVFI